MRVLINTLSHVGGGGITYLKNMLLRFAESEHEFLVLVPADRNKLNEPPSDNVTFKSVDVPVDVLPIRLLYEQLVIPIQIARWNVDVLFSPADLTPLLTSCPTLLAIRNPNPYFSASRFGLERPFSRRVKFFVQRHLTKLSANKADQVFFVSNFSKEVSNQFLDIPPSKLNTIHHGIDPSLFRDPDPASDERLRATLAEHAPYVLTVSTITEHKNYETLLRGFAKLSPQLRAEFPLVIAGRTPSQEYFEHLQRIIAEKGIEDDVVFLGGVDYEDVPSLYAEAALYVLPSKLETFGHTLVEAMASGVPIAAAESTCIPEITGGAAVLFDPDDDSALATTLSTLLEDDERRAPLIERGKERVRDFSWDDTFSQTVRLLETVAKD